MKAFVLFCVVVAAAGSNAQNVPLTAEQIAKVKSYMGECIKESNVDMQILDEAKKGKFADDENLKKFSYCFFKKIGVIGEDGQTHIDVILNRLPGSFDKATAKKVFDDCKATRTGKDEYDTAYEVIKCYYAGTDQHVIVD